MNTYEEKQARRKEYYEAKAAAARAESHEQYNTFKKMADVIPMGQPILVGHHSEKSDRAYRGRMTGHMDKSIELSKKAEYYQQKAESVGQGGISGYDPDAVTKLKEKLDKLKEQQERMKAANKALRLKDTEKGNARLREQGYSEKQIEELRTPDCFGCIGFASYTLTNNNANIRRIEKRIKQLEAAKEHEGEEKETDLYSYRIEDARVQFTFDGKPEPCVRDILKRHGFKWAPSRGAWVRQATANGRYAAKSVMQELDDLEAFDNE